MPPVSKSYLLCPPDYFGANFLFNPWMTYREEVDSGLAKRQWEALLHAIDARASVKLLKPDPYQNALVFTRDNAFVYAPGETLLLRSFGPRGKAEPRILKSWFTKESYRVRSVPRGMFLEGGNILNLGNNRFIAGWKGGDSLVSYQWLSKFLKVHVHENSSLSLVRLVDLKYLHLDMVMAPLGERGFLVYPEGLNVSPSWKNAALWEGKPVITISRKEAERFGANAVVVGNTVITGGISDRTAGRIGALGFDVERIDLSEFCKAGGGAHCLTLDLYPV